MPAVKGLPTSSPNAARRPVGARPAADSLTLASLPGRSRRPSVAPSGPVWASSPKRAYRGYAVDRALIYLSDTEPVGLALRRGYNRSACSTEPGLPGGTVRGTRGVGHA